MIEPLHFLGDVIDGPRAAIVLRVTIVLLVAAFLCACLRRASAAARHWVWTLGLGGSLALPLVAFAVPTINVPILSGATVLVGESSGPPEPSVPDDRAAEPPVFPPTFSAAGVDSAVAEHAVQGEPDRARSSEESARPAGAVGPSAARGRWLVTAWLFGLGLIAIPAVVGQVGVLWLAARSRAVADKRWLATLSELAAQLGIRRAVHLRETARAMSPTTWGIVRPVILLPSSWRQWPEARTRSAILHELAHVRRHDCLTQLIGRLACLVYWFHPLVWLAARQLRRERERAADDTVLRGGAPAARYAEQLLEIARQLGGRGRLWDAAPAMARCGQLEGRLLAVLDEGRNRGALGRRGALVGLVGLLCIIVPLGSMRLASRAAVAAAQDGAVIGQDDARGQEEADFSSSPVIYEPSRAEVEALLRAIHRGEDPVTDELIELAQLRFRHYWGRPFHRVAQFAMRPDFAARMDAIGQKVLGRRLSTLELLDRARGYHVGYDDAILAGFLSRTPSFAEATGKPLYTVRGNVVDQASLQPIEGALVYNIESYAATRTGAGGSFLLSVVPPSDSTVRIRIEADGYALGETVVPTNPDKPVTPLVQLVKQADYTGRVIDARSEPVANAGIRVWVKRDEICRDGSYRHYGNAAANAITLLARTDSEGRYSVRGMPRGPDTHTVWVRHPMFQNHSVKGPAAPTTTAFTITLEPGCEVSGKVVDEDGQPVFGAWVRVLATDQLYDGPDTHTDREGKFQFHNVSPGEWRLMVEPEEHAMTHTSLSADLVNPVRDLELVVKKGTYLRGIVVYGDNKPAPGVAVGWLRPVDESSLGLNRMTSTDELGVFRIGPVPAEGFVVTAVQSAPRMVGKKEATSAQTDVRVILEPD